MTATGKSRSKLLLASASPRRSEFLRQLGVDFEVVSSGCDETTVPGESPADYVKRLAAAKASAVGARFPDRIVLGADTAVVVSDSAGGDTILGKPCDLDDAKQMLELLSGRKHRVLSAYCLYRLEPALNQISVVQSEVEMITLDRQLIDAYVSSGEPMDKAGAYAVQGIGGMLIKTISGSYSNVVGLPLAELAYDLRVLGVWTPAAISL